MVRQGMWRCTRRTAAASVGGGLCVRRTLAGFLRGCAGQATVEAAVVLPAVMLVFTLLLQPVCLSYTRAVMRAAAAESARAAATAYGGDVGACRSFALRRLRAVPDVPLFHVGGEADWDVSIEQSDRQVSVRIAGHARPLPLMGLLASAALRRDGKGLVLDVSLQENLRPSWLGGDYDAWQGIWG